MSRRPLQALVVTAALTALVVASTPAQASHCPPVFIFSGHNIGDTFGRQANPGAAGCLARDENLDTNVLVPGATFVSVGTTITPADNAPDGTGWVSTAAATLVIDGGTPIPLTLRRTATGTRWDSQNIEIHGGQQVTASVTSVTGTTGSVTYRAAV